MATKRTPKLPDPFLVIDYEPTLGCYYEVKDGYNSYQEAEKAATKAIEENGLDDPENFAIIAEVKAIVRMNKPLVEPFKNILVPVPVPKK